MQRNTLLFVSLLAVIAALLVGISIGRSIPQAQTLAPTPTPFATPKPPLAYIAGSACGVSFQYPNTLTAMESTASGLILSDATNPEESIVVVCQTDIPRAPLPPERTETRIIQAATGSASISATLYHDASQKDGTPADKLIFAHPDTGLDVFIAGFGGTFQQFISSLKLQ